MEDITPEQFAVLLPKMMKLYPDIWDANALSSHPAVTYEIVRDNQHLPWNFILLSQNPNITMEHALDIPYLPWSYYWLSRNPSTTPEMVQAYPDAPWDHSAFAE